MKPIKLKLTPARIIANLQPRKPKVLCKTPPAGSLVAEFMRDKSVNLTWRYTFEHATHEEFIGILDESSDKNSTIPSEFGFSIIAAMFKAQQMAVEHRDSINSGGDPYHKLKQIKIAQLAQARTDAANKAELTTKVLLTTYNNILTKENQKTGEDVRSLFNNIPSKLMAQQPCDITDEEWQQLLFKVAQRAPVVADRLRSYLKAVYNLAIKAMTERRIDGKATGLLDLAKFRLTTNPLEHIAPHEHGKQARPNGLSIPEMIMYWNCIKDLNGVEGATLRIHLLSGGLRPTQLIRLTSEWVKLDNNNGKFTLVEIKGSGNPRFYTTPIRSYMVKDFAYLLMVNSRGGRHLFSTDGGIKKVDRATPADWAKKAVNGTIPDFCLSRIRSGVTDLMSASSVVLDTTCDAVQSHGITNNVVNKHYRRDEKLEPKRRALGVLYKVLTGIMVINNELNDDDLAADFIYDVVV